MAKRKYLTTISLIITSNIICLPCIHASAYLPEAGHYKYYASFSFLDASSQKNRDRRASIFVEIQDNIYELGAAKQEIAQIAAEKNRPLTDTEALQIQTLNLGIDKLTEYTKELASFSYDAASSLEVEYGISENQSFGLKIGYKHDKFAEIQNDRISHKKTYIGKDIESFYKYKIFQNNRIILTLQPKLHYSRYNGYSSGNADIGLFIGHTYEGKKSTNFQEFGITARKEFGKNNNLPAGYVVSMIEGFKFKNGFMLSNYTEYEKKKSINFLYRNTIYEQISVAKTFYFDNLNVNNLTAQIGYFWKGSTSNYIYTISGPILSLWCDL